MEYEMDPEQAFLNSMKMDAYNPEHDFMNTDNQPTEGSEDKKEEENEEIEEEEVQTGTPLETHNVEIQKQSTPSNVPVEDTADANTAVEDVTSSDSPSAPAAPANVQDESVAEPQVEEPSGSDNSGAGDGEDAQNNAVNPPSAVEVQLRDSESVPPYTSTPTPQPAAYVPTPTPEPPRTSSAPPNTENDGVNLGAATLSNKRRRLPQDKVGQLEDRIAEDPRGDIDAWLRLIDEHQKKGKLDEARDAYERFLKIWPNSASQWIAYAKMELANNELRRVEGIFQRCLLSVLSVEICSLYLDYIRRINNLATDAGGRARAIISQAYEFVLNHVGIDKESTKIWQDYILFIKSGPGTVGGTAWQDQQKMDHLRKVYQRVICIPIRDVDQLWREYDQFEMSLNKLTGRKFTQEKSPYYMTARACLHQLNEKTSNLNRHSLARLPPIPGFEGYQEWQQQLSLWRGWVAWEKEDNLVLAKDDPETLKQRIIYVYKQAVMALRFEPQIWFDYAEFLLSQDTSDQAMEVLRQGISANPESCLLHFKLAELLESTIPAGDSQEAIRNRGQAVRKPYDDLLNTLYGLSEKLQHREREEIAKIEALDTRSTPNPELDEATDGMRQNAIKAIREGMKAQQTALQKTISAVWINLMRAMRRIEGHGKVNGPIGGSRQIFMDARRRGKITSDVFVASALIEYHCYKDPSATKIFERGMKLFPEDEDFALEYLKHLLAINDVTNARAVFETFVGKVSPEKAKKVYRFFHEYESHYGELGQVYKLEKRMAELYPEDSMLSSFGERYSYSSISPCNYAPVISLHQLKPPMPLPPPPPVVPAPIPQAPAAPPQRITDSPKRSLDDANVSDADQGSHRPRKIHRPDSPLKGAAGRKLKQERQQQQRIAGRGQQAQSAPAPQPLPDGVMFLLGILPGADKYHATRFNAEAIVTLLRNVELPPPPPFGR